MSYKPAAESLVSYDDRKSAMSKVTAKFDYKMKLQMEVEKMKDQIKNICGEYYIIDQENLLRDNKRQIVNLITENIYTLRHGFKDADQIVLTGEYVQKLIRLMLRREKKLQIID